MTTTPGQHTNILHVILIKQTHTITEATASTIKFYANGMFSAFYRSLKTLFGK